MAALAFYGNPQVRSVHLKSCKGCQQFMADYAGEQEGNRQSLAGRTGNRVVHSMKDMAVRLLQQLHLRCQTYSGDLQQKSTD